MKLKEIKAADMQTNNFTLITEKIEYEYSLDDQCRMEFDRGYSFCRSFQLPDPCEHLWCAHQDTPLLCKTKKGPPMDGTACGKEKVIFFSLRHKTSILLSGVSMGDVRAPAKM